MFGDGTVWPFSDRNIWLLFSDVDVRRLVPNWLGWTRGIEFQDAVAFWLVVRW